MPGSRKEMARNWNAEWSTRCAPRATPLAGLQDRLSGNQESICQRRSLAWRSLAAVDSLLHLPGLSHPDASALRRATLHHAPIYKGWRRGRMLSLQVEPLGPPALGDACCFRVARPAALGARGDEKGCLGAGLVTSLPPLHCTFDSAVRPVAFGRDVSLIRQGKDVSARGLGTETWSCLAC